VQVQATAQATGAVRTATTDSAGMFRFPNLVPGAYTLAIKAAGFKTWSSKDISLATAETRDVGRIVLEIGSLAEQIEVTAQATPVQVGSSEKAGLVDADQLKALTLKGRDAFNFMQLLPGVLDTNDRNTPGTGGDGGISVNGNTTSMGNFVDGIANRDVGANGGVHFVPNMDAIGEVRLLASNYQAEYGRNSGGIVTIVTKSGSKDFHGSAWWIHRHEGMNANGYFRNSASQARSIYRYHMYGFSVGGPVYIPRVFNTDKTKFFFFVSQERINQFVPTSEQKRMMPTAAELGGDFSNSLQSNGSLIVIKDPLNNMAPFSNNQIPLNRFNPLGLALLNFLPKGGNYTPAAGTTDYRQYNFYDSASAPHPQTDTVIRGDVYVTSKLSGYLRMVRNRNDQDSLYNGIQWATSTTKPGASMAQIHPNPGRGEAASATYVFTPTMLNQVTVGHSYNVWAYWMKDASLADRAQLGVSVPSLYPDKKLGASLANPADIDMMHPWVPQANFGGGSRPNPGSIGWGGYAGAYYNWNDIWVIQDNFTAIVGPHNFKAGIYIEEPFKTQPQNNNWMGQYNFNHDANNPISSGDGYANALLGNFTTYQEANFREIFKAAYMDVAWYVQDNWRVNRRLTLDLGIRMTHMQPMYDQFNSWAVFRESLYSSSKMPRMYQPYCDTTFTGTSCPTGHRFGRDATTGATVPFANIGQFVPGSGDPANGMQVLGVNGVSKYSYSQRLFLPGPRVGFAWDVFGNGKTAVRGGFGIVFDQLQGNEVYNMGQVPPLTYQPTVYYSTIASLSSGATGLIGPTGIGTSLYGQVPGTRVQNTSLSVQQALRGGTVLEVGYVGNWGYNLSSLDGTRNNLNYIPLGTRFLSQNIDPTTGSPLSDNFLRTKYPGYSDIYRSYTIGHTNYHGIQVSLQRRYSHGLSFGMAYTFSKSLGVTNFNNTLPDNESFYYGPNGNYRKHIFAFNYVYDFPNLGRRLNNKALGVVTDRWSISGITSAQTGAPYTPVCNSQSSIDITGTPNLATGGTNSSSTRCLVIGDPTQSLDPGMVYNPRALVLTPVGTIGNLSNNPLSFPGWQNWDIVLTKSIPVGLGEGRLFKLQVQAYNAFNMTQFNGWNTGASFTRTADPTSLVANTSLGRPTGTKPARIIATSLRFEF
jgi:hypothetical protein